MGWIASFFEWFKKEEPEINFVRPRRKVSKVFLHCSASDNPAHDSVEVIRGWHKQKGWSDVGYHYYINKKGVMQLGRPLNKIPAAQVGHNTGSIAICLGGLEDFTSAQFETLTRLCIAIEEGYDGVITFHGHCEVSNKSCPVYPYRSILKLDQRGVLGV